MRKYLDARRWLLLSEALLMFGDIVLLIVIIAVCSPLFASSKVKAYFNLRVNAIGPRLKDLERRMNALKATEDHVE